jgi:hypothetical protein
MPHGDRDRDWSSVSNGQGATRMAGLHQKVGGRVCKKFSQEPLAGTNSWLSDFKPPEL